MLPEVHLEVEPHALAARRHSRDLQALQLQVPIGEVQQLEQHLDEWAAAEMSLGLQLLDQLLERELLMVIGGQ